MTTKSPENKLAASVRRAKVQPAPAASAGPEPGDPTPPPARPARKSEPAAGTGSRTEPVTTRPMRQPLFPKRVWPD